MSSRPYPSLPELVPDEQLERVTSIDLLSSFGLLPGGSRADRWDTNAWEVATVYIVGSAVTVLADGLGLLYPAIRRRD